MAVRRDTPYAGFNFLVEIDGVAVAGFAEVSGLSHSIEVITYREGSDSSNAVRKLPGLHKVGDVTLKRGIAGGLELFEWLKQARDGAAAKRRVVLTLLAEDRSQVMRWILADAFPVKLTHGPLLALASNVAVEELVLAAHGLELE